MEALFTQAWNLGGFAVAFIVAMVMLREVWKQRLDDLKTRVAEKDADRTELLKALMGASSAIARSCDNENAIVAALTITTTESRARTAEVLQSIESMKVGLAEHVAMTAMQTAAAKASNDAAMAIMADISKRQQRDAREKKTVVTTSMT